MKQFFINNKLEWWKKYWLCSENAMYWWNSPKIGPNRPSHLKKTRSWLKWKLDWWKLWNPYSP